MKRYLPFPLLVLSLAGSSCIETSQEPVSYEAVSVLAPGGDATVQDGWAIAVTRADVALGPFYFCAAASGSSTLCESAAAELTTVSYVDALAPPTPLGRVHGFTGKIESAAYDLGISWFDTQTEPTPAAALPAGHSLHLEGRATKAGRTVTFVADVDVTPQYQGQSAVATAPASADVTGAATRLEVALAPAGWLRQLDFDAIAASGPEPFVIAPGMPEHVAVLVGLKNLAPITMRWVDAR
ncbi:MAG: hypothetical protein JWP97_3778 [Labilithrix sp.]|nr:hypothetical protein [Labilithrix sp.]